MTPKISIIVPIYKAERYLHQCIDSILAQTYTNLEIILVNDGSPDNCGAICDEYAQKDGRIKVIHKENGGVATARNIGIDTAAGEYLAFMDSDDWIEPEMIDLLYNSLINNDADVSCCGFYWTYVNMNVPEYHKEEKLVFNSEEAVEQVLTNGNVSVVPWAKLYKRHIFDETRYPVDKLFEDNLIIIDLLMDAEKITVDTKSGYYYRQVKSSRVNSFENDRERALAFFDVIEVYRETVEKKCKRLVPAAEAVLYQNYISLLASVLIDKNHDKKSDDYKFAMSAVEKIRTNFEHIITNPYFTTNQKIKLYAIKININLYKFLQMINDKKKELGSKNGQRNKSTQSFFE